MERFQNQKWLKITLLAIVGLLLVGGLVWAGVLIGRQQAIRDTQYVIRISPIPSPLISFSPTLLPTFSPETTSSPDETAGWKTYTTEILLFKYPPAWTIKETIQDFFVLLPEISIPPQSAPISLDARLEKTYDQSIQDNKENLVELNAEVMTVAGKPATKISGRVGPGFGEGTFVISVIIDYRGKAITLYYSWEEKKIYQQTFNLLLSTFRFLD